MKEGDIFSNITVLALEQAIVVPYFTYKFVLEGAEVIRIEHPVIHDPNRLVGENILSEEKMNSYYLTINSGKKSVTLNLKEKKAQEIFYTMIKKLNIDIFVTNQLPKNYKKLGIDYDSIKKIKGDIIWIGVTGFGANSNEGAYDPILQARGALMDLTGEPNGDPQVVGIPLPDMGSSEQIYGLAMKALFKRATTGEGSKIDFSMFRSTVSWHAINIPMVATFKKNITRRGNTHEFFAPVSVYKTTDGYIYLAVGNNRQWKSLVNLTPFKSLDIPEYELNEGRIRDVENLNKKINDITSKLSTATLIEMLRSITVPVSKINKLNDLLSDDLLKGEFLKTKDKKTGFEIKLAPPAYSSNFIKETEYLDFPPRLGEHNKDIYCNILGLNEDNLEQLKQDGII